MNKLTNCLVNKNTSCTPIWFMRQAGRYLPEFRDVRSKNLDFIKLCLNSDLSSTITLQPIKRFDINAAIIFSDILMVPYALGQEVKFEKNSGPKLSKLNLETFLKKDEKEFIKTLNPVYEAITKTRKKLNSKINLISFIGSPWTLIVYILGLKKEKNVLDVKLTKELSVDISILIKKLNTFLCLHIKKQVDAGADLVQIFDSWSGLIPSNKLNEYCYEPNLHLVNFCKKNKIPVICFPKGLNENYKSFNDFVKPTGISIDYDVDPEWAREELNGTCIQAEKYLKIFKNYPYIFNLGHGLLPETKPDSVKELINFVRNFK